MKPSALSMADIHNFMEKGFVKINNVFSEDFIRDWWGPRQAFFEATATYADCTHVHCPVFRRFNPSSACPKAVVAAEDLLGGKERIKKQSLSWGDGFVVAQPLPAAPSTKEADDIYTWHIDGFKNHCLNYSDIGLVGLILWTDANSDNGATSLAAGSHKIIARQLVQTPNGMSNEEIEALDYSSCAEHRATGKAGDMYFLHPLLLHSRKKNNTSSRRAITNPHVSLKESLKFDRPNKNYSVLEKSILQAVKMNSIIIPSIEPNNQVAFSKVQDTLSEERIYLRHIMAQFKP